MSYQYSNSGAYLNLPGTGASGVNTGNRYSQTVGGGEHSNSHYLGAVGDILTGTLIQGGESPIVEMNGTPIQVRSTALKDIQPGEQIYLQITQSCSSEITMKLVNQKELPVNTRSGAMQTEIRKNTATFVENWKQNQQNNTSEAEQMQEDADYILQSITDEEKARLRQMGLEITSSNVTLIKGILTQMRGNEHKEEFQETLDNIRRQILLENPPKASGDVQIHIQEDTLDVSALTREANSLLPVTEEQTAYFIQNECAISIDNLYKAEYCGTVSSKGQGISEAAFQQLRPQIEHNIRTAGMEVNAASLNAARFLLDHQLPVNSDSLSLYTAIQNINANGFQDTQVADRFMDASAEALAGRSVSYKETLTVEFYRSTELYFPSAGRVADQMQEDMQQITETALQKFAETGLPYTLENLSAFCRNAGYRDIADQTYTDSFSDPTMETGSIKTEKRNTNAELEAMTAHRQLEELRLKMTWEASYSLAIEDIHIRAKELTQVVEALRNQEQDYCRQQFQADGVEPSAALLKLVQDTNHKMQELPYLPAAALGVTLLSSSFTVERLHAAGTASLQEMNVSISYTKAAAYETLMTRPRSDMGDSIEKAFRNVDDILEDLELPVTEDNQRAVRILGYNQMEITPENLDQIKAADKQVQTLIQNLQPSVVLNLVRDGVNPLNMAIDQLNDLVQEYINEEDIAEEEKYSAFLQKLDRHGAITREERKGYIGIYRLLNKVTRSKGKDIGTLVRNGQDITLQNLLTAHRSNRATGLDTTVDEDFGGLEITAGDDSISDQIQEGVTARYNQQLAEQLQNRITPELIDDMVEEASRGTTLEEFFDTIQKQLTEEPDTREASSLWNSGEEPAAAAIQDMQLQNIEAFDEASYRFMRTMEIFPSITNMIMTAELLKGTGGIFREIAGIHKNTAKNEAAGDEAENATDTEGSIGEQLDTLPEHLNSPEEMEQAYARLEDSVTETVHQKDNTGTITAKDIQSLKQIRAGLRIMQKMSRREQFQIPFSFQGEWNVINLSVIQNAETRGLLQADIPTREYGTISASLSWKQTHWEGTISADQPEGTALLERNSALISDTLDQITAGDKATASEQEPATGEMYRMAKQLVMLFRHLEA